MKLFVATPAIEFTVVVEKLVWCFQKSQLSTKYFRDSDKSDIDLLEYTIT